MLIYVKKSQPKSKISDSNSTTVHPLWTNQNFSYPPSIKIGYRLLFQKYSRLGQRPSEREPLGKIRTGRPFLQNRQTLSAARPTMSKHCSSEVNVHWNCWWALARSWRSQVCAVGLVVLLERWSRQRSLQLSAETNSLQAAFHSLDYPAFNTFSIKTTLPRPQQPMLLPTSGIFNQLFVHMLIALAGVWKVDYPCWSFLSHSIHLHHCTTSNPISIVFAFLTSTASQIYLS